MATGSIFDKEFGEILVSQVVSILGGLIAGILLAIHTDRLILIPGMLVLLPGFLEMRGNISGSFASRLSAGLFIGVVKPTLRKTHLIKGNLIASFLLAIVISVFLGVLAFAFNYIVTGVSTPVIIGIAVLAGILANAIEIPLTLVTLFYLFRRGHDPNNFMGPFVTSTGDITSIVALLLAMVIL